MTTTTNRWRGCSRSVLVACGLAGTGLLSSAALSGPINTRPAAGVPRGGETATGVPGPITAQRPTAAPIAGLTADELERFFIGREAFARDITVEEGLGPIFNQTACGDCHITPLGGTGTTKVLRAGQQTKGGFDPLEEFGGSLFQLESINKDCAENPPPQANVFTDRVTNGMTGYGLVEAILDSDIQAVRDAQDISIRGDAHMVGSFEDEVIRVGRFGWKAQVATLLTFSADAGLQEMGLTNRFLMEDNDPNGIDPPTLAECDTVADPEDSVAMGNGVDREFIDVVTDFQRFMTQPPQTPKSGMTGEILFNNLGCADCHTKTWTTPNDPSLETALRNKTIHPYGDFLLHDMGANGDGIPQGDALASFLKTPPLWDLRHRMSIWHDGRFESGGFDVIVGSAIAEHDDGQNLSQGRFAAQAYAALPAAAQQAVLNFLRSLGQLEFDPNNDDTVTLLDFANAGNPDTFRSCYLSTPTPDASCAIHDVDQDGLVDQAVDFATFLTVYTGQLSDCNQNGVLDMIDILDGTAVDADDDGVIDTCEPTCFGDVDGDGMVGIIEFLQVIADWGLCPALPAPCESDYNLDGVVGVNDLLISLAQWGPCQ